MCERKCYSNGTQLNNSRHHLIVDFGNCGCMKNGSTTNMSSNISCDSHSVYDIPFAAKHNLSCFHTTRLHLPDVVAHSKSFTFWLIDTESYTPIWGFHTVGYIALQRFFHDWHAHFYFKMITIIFQSTFRSSSHRGPVSLATLSIAPVVSIARRFSFNLISTASVGFLRSLIHHNQIGYPHLFIICQMLTLILVVASVTQQY